MYRYYPDKFLQYTRLLPAQYDYILDLIKDDITVQDTTFCDAIPARVRLFIALRYLASGDSLRSIATSFSVGQSTVRGIVKKTLSAIWERLSQIYVKPPTKEGWLKIIKGFEDQWNFPNCLGAIDGKHVVLEAPPRTGSLFYNYKGTFSIVLLAACDADYLFTYIDIGAYGRESDGGIFRKSTLCKNLSNASLPIPESLPIKNSDYQHPCTFVGDEAFSLSTYMMRPYPGRELPIKRRIFNYRLSRARRTIENTFGLMASRFRIFRRPITQNPDNAELIVKACIALHNYLRTEDLIRHPNQRTYCPMGFADEDDQDNGQWRQEGEAGLLKRISSFGSNKSSKLAQRMRDNLANYFVNSGKVAWQNERAGILNVD